MNLTSIAALNSGFSGSPESKYFLVKFLSKYPNGTEPIFNLSDLAADLGFTKQVALRCINRLVDQEWLAETRNGRREKPFRKIHLGRHSRSLEISSVRTSTYHDQHMEQLLVWGEQPVEERRHQLAISKRLILLLLLSQADAFGLVRDVGLGAIGRATGLSESQARNNVKLLTQHHYIANSVPGGNFPGWVGKVASTYLLNLRHLRFGDLAIKHVTCLIEFSPSVLLSSTHEATRLSASISGLKRQIERARLSKSSASRNTIAANDLQHLCQFLGAKVTARYRSRMQWELQDIASEIINADMQDEDANGAICCKLRRRVLKQISYDQSLSEEEKAEALDPALEILRGYVFEIIARTRKVLDQIPVNRSDSSIIQILPKHRSDDSNQRTTIEILSADIQESNDRVLLVNANPETGQLLKHTTKEGLNDLRFDYLKQFGLSSLPISHARLRPPPKRKDLSGPT